MKRTRSIVQTIIFGTLAGVVVIAFQNCGQGFSPSMQEGAAVATKGFPSRESNMDTTAPTAGGVTITPGNRTDSPRPNPIDGTASSPTEPKKYVKKGPTFSIETVRNGRTNRHLELVIRQVGSVKFISVNAQTTDIYPTFLQRFVLTQSVPGFIRPELLRSFSENGATFYVYELELTNLMIQKELFSLSVTGFCDVVDAATGALVVDQGVFDCDSNSVAASAHIGLYFSGPTEVKYGQPLPQPFVVKGIEGTMAGCNLEDRRDAPGASIDGSVGGCRWLVAPAGWINRGGGNWEYNSPLSSSGTYARLVVADIVNGNVSRVSVPLRVVFSHY